VPAKAMEFTLHDQLGDLRNGLPLEPHFASVTSRTLSPLQFTGTLPATWGSASVFQQLLSLDVSQNMLDGGLPEAWGESPAWPQLRRLSLAANNLSGTIPDSWVEIEVQHCRA